MSDLLSCLNNPQCDAVTTINGPLLIIAGPGSGKTRVITHRIAYLVQHQHISPWNILAVTFTNRAAKEMRERLEKLVGLDATRVMTIGTFHHLCVIILHREADYLLRYGMTAHFTIADREDALKAVKLALSKTDVSMFQHLFLDPKKGIKPREIQECISRAKAHMLSAEKFEKQAKNDIERVASRVFPLYERILRANNSLDFDDILLFCEHLLRSQPHRLHVYQKRWAYLHIDEFQDCNLPQYKLIRLLALGTETDQQGSQNVCAVGDDDQMVFQWRGASIDNLKRFETDFPQHHVVMLEQNYRSTSLILHAAQAIVAVNIDRKKKNLWTSQAGGERVILYTAPDERAEAAYIAAVFHHLKQQGDLQYWSDAAILYRINAQSRALEEKLRHAHIPYVVIGSHSFYERQEIKDMLAYLSLLLNPQDTLSLLRIINRPARKLGDITVGKIQQWAEQKGFSLSHALEQIYSCPGLPSTTKQTCWAFHTMIERLTRESTRLPLPELLDRVIEETHYDMEFMKSEDIDRQANVMELRKVMEDFSEDDPELALRTFLEETVLLGGADITQTSENGHVTSTRDREEDAIKLITLHSAKGLEFPVVAIIGLNEGSLPHSRAFEQQEIEEERRLTYVGVTRAKQRLYLLNAERRQVFGETKDTVASRFLHAIPERCVTKESYWN